MTLDGRTPISVTQLGTVFCVVARTHPTRIGVYVEIDHRSDTPAVMARIRTRESRGKYWSSPPKNTNEY